MAARGSFLIAATLFLLLPDSQDAIARDLTLEDRINAQEAIERVYWEHRIWPPGNRAPKPLFEKVFTRPQIRARVVDTIRESNALAAIWNRPITAEQLQDEMRRMAAESRAPDVLRELFAALGDDPFTIAETLARQTLADRLIREAYANDAESQRMSFHQGGALFNGHGGRYDRSLSTWVPMSRLGAPLAWAASTAVWTGREMLVWVGTGGTSNGYSGRYCASACEAGTGAAEVCNGTDDNCNSVIDEGGDALCDDTESCTTDACGGAVGCSHAPIPIPGPVEDTVEASHDETTQVTTLVWSAIPSATHYSTYKGTIPLATMGSRPQPYDHACHESGDAAGDGPMLSTDGTAPPTGTAFYYLEDGENSCSEGSLGTGRAADGSPIAGPNSFPCPTPP